MATTPPDQCAACGENATIKCDNCIDHLDHHALPTPTSYCSKDCQDAHQTQHKDVCRKFNSTTLLYRTGKLLKQAFLEYRKVVYDCEVVSIEREKGRLHIHTNHAGDGTRMFRSLPSNLIHNLEEEHILLSHEGCVDAIAQFQHLMTKFITGRLHHAAMPYIELTLYTPDIVSSGGYMSEQNSPMPTSEATLVKSIDGVRALDDTHPVKHEVAVVHLPQSTFYLDLSGAQYGQSKAVLTQTEYIQRYVDKAAGKEVNQRKYGEVATARWNSAVGRPDSINFAQWEISGVLLSSLAAWEDKSGLTVHDLLRSKHAVFKSGVEELMLQCRLDMIGMRGRMEMRPSFNPIVRGVQAACGSLKTGVETVKEKSRDEVNEVKNHLKWLMVN